jgi:hypothetical protein
MEVDDTSMVTFLLTLITIFLLSLVVYCFVDYRVKEKILNKLIKLDMEIHQTRVEVTTLDGSTLANLADDAETRRILEVKVSERTQAEVEHVEVIPPVQ